MGSGEQPPLPPAPPVDIPPPPGDPTIPVIRVSVDRMAPSDPPTDLPQEHIKRYIRDAENTVMDLGVPDWIAHFIAVIIGAFTAVFMLTKDIVIFVARVFLPTWGVEIFRDIDSFRQTLDPTFGALAVSVLNELLGTELDAGDLSQGIGTTAHLDRAEKLGGLFHGQLLSEFLKTGVVTPESGVAAAHRFSGLAINFGTATGILAFIGGLLPFFHLDEIREVGEQVASNLALGRLQRLALTPLINITIAEPYKWYLNQKARPTQLTHNDLVNPYTGAVMDQKLVQQALIYEGYSDDKIAALLELHRKKLTESDLGDKEGKLLLGAISFRS